MIIVWLILWLICGTPGVHGWWLFWLILAIAIDLNSVRD